MLRLRDLLEREGDPLQLEALTGDAGLDRQVPDPEVASPGLALAGYVGRFAPHRLHVLGETEITYLNGLAADERLHRLEQFFNFDLPCLFITKGLDAPPDANGRGMSVATNEWHEICRLPRQERHQDCGASETETSRRRGRDSHHHHNHLRY
jgi:serine kinase of HPr protein (carbohydrate metabolism regulator)